MDESTNTNTGWNMEHSNLFYKNLKSLRLLNLHISLEYECGDSDSSDCTSEYNNAVNNGNLEGFFDRCANEGGSQPLRARCSLCCSQNNQEESNESSKNNHYCYLTKR